MQIDRIVLEISVGGRGLIATLYNYTSWLWIPSTFEFMAKLASPGMLTAQQACNGFTNVMFQISEGDASVNAESSGRRSTPCVTFHDVKYEIGGHCGRRKVILNTVRWDVGELRVQNLESRDPIIIGFQTLQSWATLIYSLRMTGLQYYSLI